MYLTLYGFSSDLYFLCHECKRFSLNLSVLLATKIIGEYFLILRFLKSESISDVWPPEPNTTMVRYDLLLAQKRLPLFPLKLLHNTRLGKTNTSRIVISTLATAAATSTNPIIFCVVIGGRTAATVYDFVLFAAESE